MYMYLQCICFLHTFLVALEKHDHTEKDVDSLVIVHAMAWGAVERDSMRCHGINWSDDGVLSKIRNPDMHASGFRFPLYTLDPLSNQSVLPKIRVRLD